MKKFGGLLSAFYALVAMTFIAGCQEPAAPETAASSNTNSAAAEHGHEHTEGEGEHAHGHGAGPHDGTLADWGGGKYHVEFTVSHDKQEATVYVLGSDEKTPAPIKADKVLLTIGDPELMAELREMATWLGLDRVRIGTNGDVSTLLAKQNRQK